MAEWAGGSSSQGAARVDFICSLFMLEARQESAQSRGPWMELRIWRAFGTIEELADVTSALIKTTSLAIFG